jgi:eukaryotic-like serine/threonine-protein kinase
MTVIGKRYQLEAKIGGGGMGNVHRALDKLTGQRIALKQVTSPSERLSFASVSSATMSGADFRLALAQEFRTLASLRHPNIISVLDYGFDESFAPFFTMDLLEDAETIVEAAEGQSVSQKMQLIGQCLQALSYLHRRNILHRDIKPTNVMVTGGLVKVLDFGLATDKRQQVESENIVGTLAYLAPEVLSGAALSPASDLYAVGVILYELLLGKHPFNTEDWAMLLNDIIYNRPNLDALDRSIAAVLERLLSKTPEERYQNATELAQALGEAIGETLMSETSATRESFLQAAAFVGRENELKILKGSNASWLIGGESGVGKSRLLEELRTLALVEGATVLRGQAVSEAGIPYQLWRDVLRWLALQADANDFEASVLKPLVGDIDSFLGRKVGDAPSISPQAAQDRLIDVVEAIIKRQTGRGLLIILEDLHWAGSESLALLARLSQSLAGKIPLIIIGSYRDDESPNLPESLPAMRELKLERLGTEQIANLSEAILGEAGKEQHIVQLLERETEGNAFFLVEVMRALAEEAGSLQSIGRKTLPEKVFASGVQSIVHRRLERVSSVNRPLLELAAVLGRQLDLALLQHENLEAWLNDCANAAVLDIGAGAWRFAHDKLREGVLAELSPEKRRALNQEAAEAIEKVYPDASQELSALAYHWSEAGNVPKSLYYLEKAAAQALSNGAYQAAIDDLRKALEIGGNPSKETLANWHQILAEAFTGIGDPKQARDEAAKAVALMDYPMPRGLVRLAAAILRESLIQVLHRLLPASAYRQKNPEHLLKVAQSYERIFQAEFYRNRILEAVFGALRAFNLAESASDLSPILARNLATMGTLLGVVPLHAFAVYYAERARDAAARIDDLSARSWALQVTSIYYLGRAAWEKLRIEEALQIAREIGDQRRMAEMSVLPTWGIFMQAKFQEALERYQAGIELGTRIGDKQTITWASQGRVSTLMRMGRSEEAMAVNDDPKVKWVFSLGYLRLGQYEEAEAALEPLVKRMGHRPMQVYQFDMFATIAEVRVKIYEAAPTEQRRLAARIAVETLGRYGKVFPISKPRALLWRGLLLYQEGQQNKAKKLWEESLALACKLELPYDIALAHYELGRHGSKEHLSQAAEEFECIGASYDVKMAREAFNKEI